MCGGEPATAPTASGMAALITVKARGCGSCLCTVLLARSVWFPVSRGALQPLLRLPPSHCPAGQVRAVPPRVAAFARSCWPGPCGSPASPGCRAASVGVAVFALSCWPGPCGFPSGCCLRTVLLARSVRFPCFPWLPCSLCWGCCLCTVLLARSVRFPRSPGSALVQSLLCSIAAQLHRLAIRT